MQNVVDSVTQVQPNICRNLVISGATRVQLFSNFAYPVGQGAFNVHMYIFKTNRPFHRALFDVLCDAIESFVMVLSSLLVIMPTDCNMLRGQLSPLCHKVPTHDRIQWRQ